MHLDFAPDIAGGAVFPYLESMANQSFGMVLGKGGADTMIRALERMLTAAGGKIFTGAEVAEITTSGGKATGVRLASGETHTATQGGDRRRRARRAAGQAAAERLRRRRLRHGDAEIPPCAGHDDDPSGARRSAGLDAPAPSFGNSPMSISRPSLDAMARTYQQAIAGLLPAEPVLVVGQPTAVDPSRAPAGKHVLWVQVRMLPAEIAGDAAGEIAPDHWDQVKERYADRVIGIIESYAPGLQQKILGRSVFSPLDLERENPNLVGGDQICGSHHLSQNFLFRPARGFARWNTPVEKLHLVGAATWPGAGTGAGSGFLLAQQLGGR